MKNDEVKKPNYLIIGIMAVGFIGVLIGVKSILKSK